jgi:hypothetical protein
VVMEDWYRSFKRNALVLVIVLLLLASVSSAVDITSISQNSPTIGLYEKFELTFTLDTSYSNPFDLAIIDITLRLTRPDQTQITVPAFFYREYEVVGSAPERYENPGPEQWKVRFAPSAIGAYSFDILIDEAGDVTEFPDMGTFTCAPGRNKEFIHKGFIRLDNEDPLSMKYDDASPRMNIGHNVCWVSDELAGCQNYYNNMAAAAENWTRIWMCPWGDDGWVIIECTNDHWSGNFSGVGVYSLQTSQRLDSVVDLAEQLGIAIQLVLQYHGLFSTTTNANWDVNPYNAARPQDGGFLDNPEDFFSNAEAIRLTKNKYRYIIARWGYSPAILAWELWNEVQYTDGWAKTRPDVITWHQEMADYIRAVDPHKHLITTSSHTSGFEDIWPIDTIDIIQVHHYGTPVINTFKTTPWQLGNQYQKPVIIGEYGAGSVDGLNSETNVEDLPEPYKTQMLEGLVLHNGIWSAFHARSSSHLWWWDWYIEPYNHYQVFAPLAQYMEGEDVRGMQQAERAVLGFQSYLANPQITDFWYVHTQTDFYLVGDSFPDMDKLSRFLQGSWHEEQRSDPTFHLTMPEAGQLIIHVSEVSSYADCSLRVLVNSSEVFSSTYPAGATNFKINVPLPAGPLSVQVENTGLDWFVIPTYEFAPGAVDLLDTAGLIKDDRALIWIYDINSRYGGTPSGTFSGELLLVKGLADGMYNVDFYATRDTDGIIHTLNAESSSELLTCTIPDFNQDIAVKVRPACVVDIDELTLLADYWLQNGSLLPADFNHDAKINIHDLSLLSAYWLDFCPPNWPTELND